MALSRQRVGVVGAGMMGREIALVFALAGHAVKLTDSDPAALQDAVRHNQDILEAGRHDAAAPAIVDGLDAFSDLDLAIEAVFEDAAVKAEVLAALDRVCPPDCVIASNTSSIPITDLAQNLAPPRRGRFVGMHFASPVARMAFLELIPGAETDPATVDYADAIGRDVGKRPTRSADVPGFASNRLLFALLTEAMRLVEEGVATPADIDATCRLALGHPLGPCRLMDTISNPLVQQVRDILRDAYGERFATGPLLDEMVEAGRIGRKAGEGWHRYEDKGLK